jgi:hypothetical protein
MDVVVVHKKAKCSEKQVLTTLALALPTISK